MPTAIQKRIFAELCNGGHLVASGVNKYTLRDFKCNPISRVREATVWSMKELMKKVKLAKSCKYVLNKKAVIALRKNSFYKKFYTGQRVKVAPVEKAETV